MTKRYSEGRAGSKQPSGGGRNEISGETGVDHGGGTAFGKGIATKAVKEAAGVVVNDVNGGAFAETPAQVSEIGP